MTEIVGRQKFSHVGGELIYGDEIPVDKKVL